MAKIKNGVLTSQKRDVADACARAIGVGEQLIEAMRPHYSVESLEYIAYLAVGRTMILYGESLELAYQKHVKSSRRTNANSKVFERQMQIVESLENLLNIGLQSIEKIHQPTRVLLGIDWTWITQINARWYARKFGIQQSATMTDQAFIRCLLELMNMEHGLIEAGWDQLAIQAYSNHAKHHLETLSDIYEETQRVGSPTYLRLFHASGYSAKGKVALVMQQMGARIDTNGMLQLTGYRFDPQMPPHSVFWERFAATVKSAYPRGLDPEKNPDVSKEALKIIHQFRMYIDRQNIRYVRMFFEGATDLEKLLVYGQTHRLLFSQTSRLHNRFSDQHAFSGQINNKVTTKNGLSEFIVNVETGEFVTQWDVLQEQNGQVGIFSDDYQPDSLAGKKMVETESFNYSKNPQEHPLFDVIPANAKKGLEHDLKIAAKKYWKSETWVVNGRRYVEKYTKKSDYKIFEK